jgi:hypothetical protein
MAARGEKRRAGQRSPGGSRLVSVGAREGPDLRRRREEASAGGCGRSTGREGPDLRRRRRGGRTLAKEKTREGLSVESATGSRPSHLCVPVEEKRNSVGGEVEERRRSPKEEMERRCWQGARV